MKNSKISSTLLLIFATLMLTSCGGSSDDGDSVDPFANGDILTAMQGDWFSSACEQDFANNTSAIEILEFKFRAPLSWEDDSLEFTGSLSIQEVEFENAYCLGNGARSTDLIESEVALNNLSVIKSSVTEDSFKAFFAQTKERDFDQRLDTGSGILLDFRRTDNSFSVTPINTFTYLGQNFDLQNIEENTSFVYQNHENPIQSQNLNDVRSDELKRFLDSPTCGSFYVIDRSVVDSSGNSSRVFMVMEPKKDGVKFLYSRRAGNLFEEYQTTHLDWINNGFTVHTEKGFILSAPRGQFYLQLSHQKLNIDEQLIPQPMNRLELINLIKDKSVDPSLFETCN